VADSPYVYGGDTAKADLPYDYGAPTVFGGDLGKPPTFRFEVLRKPWNWSPPSFEAGGLLSDQGVVKWNLDNVEECSWNDVNAIMDGSITIREKFFDDLGDRGLDQGDRVRLHSTMPGGSEEPLWTMRVNKPQFDGGTLTRTFDLANDIDLVLRSEGNFYYAPGHPTKEHKQGWPGDKIIEDVCRQFQVPLVEVYQPDHKIGIVSVPKGSPLEVIRMVVEKEHKEHKMRLVVWLGPLGGLHVTELKRNTRLRALGPTLIDAAYESEFLPEFGTVISMHGMDEMVDGTVDKQNRKKGKPQKNVIVLPAGGIHAHSPEVNRYGYVHRLFFAGPALATNEGELRNIAEAVLDIVTKPVKKVTLTAPGIPGIRRGDAIQVGYRSTGESKVLIVFVKEASYQVTTGGFTMQLTCIMDDPFVDSKAMEILKRLQGSRDDIAQSPKSTGDDKGDGSTDDTGVFPANPPDPGGG
jgi:hypothetical protein